MAGEPVIGVLALQGDFEAHRRALARCGVEAREVRMPPALEGLSGLILPGGESTTLLRLVKEYGFAEAIPRFAGEGGAIFGTCAGAILLARAVRSPEQWSFGLLDIDVERNGYGRQIDSFETRLTEVASEVLAAPCPAIDAGAVSAVEAHVGGRVEPRPGAAAEGVSGVAVEACFAPGAATLDSPRNAAVSTVPDEADGLPAVFIRAPRILRVGEGMRVLASLRGEPVLVRSGRTLVSTFHPELTADPRVHSYFTRLVAYSHR